MSSRFHPSLLGQMWAELPLPEWLPAAGDAVWQQTLTALAQLWREAGQFGIAVSGPIPWLPSLEWRSDLHLAAEDLRDQRWLFTPDLSPDTVFAPGQTVIPLLTRDPAQQEPFLLLLSPVFSVVAARGEHPHTRQQGMMFSFDPEVIGRVWGALQVRLAQVRPDCLTRWEQARQHFPLQPPHARVLARFSSLLLMSASELTGGMARLPPPARVEPDPALDGKTTSRPRYVPPAPDPDPSEAELLRALIHEIKTPLTTIRTTVRLLMRKHLPADVHKHLERIDRECTEQIDRFSLFFQATEIASAQRLQLEPIALVDLVQQNLPRWRDQVQRRGSVLEMEIPDHLPDVVSDPQALDAVLSGMIDRIARSSPPGSHIVAQLVSAGEQVKLQFQVRLEDGSSLNTLAEAPQAIGQLLVLQPDTGAISLSIPVTQTLFRALGGYLTVRHKAQQGDVFTIYLPRQV